MRNDLIPSPPPSSPWTPTRIMVATLVVLGVLAGVWFIVEIRSILLLMLLGIILGAAIEPFVYRFRRAGLTRSQATLLVYLLFFATIGVALYFLIPQFALQLQALDEGIPQIFETLRHQALDSNSTFINRTGYQTLIRIESTYDRIRTSPSIGQSQVVSLASSAVGVLFTMVSMMIVAFYWTTEKATIKRLLLGLFPFPKRSRAHAIWDEIEFRIGGWTRGELALMVIIGAISGIGYYFLGVQFWLALGILAGLMELVPFIGPFIGGGAPVLVALADSPKKALFVLIFVLIYQQVEQGFLVPRIMKNAVGMSPLTVVLTILSVACSSDRSVPSSRFRSGPPPRCLSATSPDCRTIALLRRCRTWSYRRSMLPHSPHRSVRVRHERIHLLPPARQPPARPRQPHRLPLLHGWALSVASGRSTHDPSLNRHNGTGSGITSDQDPNGDRTLR